MERMQGEDERNKGAGPTGMGCPIEKAEQQECRHRVNEKIHEVVHMCVQSKKLAIEDVGKISDGQPVGVDDRSDRPLQAIDREPTGDVRVGGDVKRIVIANEVKAEHLTVG